MSAPVVTPSTYLNGYSSPVSNILQLGTQDATLKLVPQLATTEASASTGDIRRIYWGLCQMMYKSTNYIPDVANPIGNPATPRAEYNTDSTDQTVLDARKSQKMTATSSSSFNPDTLVITQTYTFTFQITPSGLEVATEV